MQTRFNVYFNGYNSFNDGLNAIYQANTDDFSSPIALYPISKHENAVAAKMNMEKTIEKSRKAIKLHSIKQKPIRDDKKWNDPAYQNWYNQKEFNPALKDAWLLLAKAEFYKGDFLGAVGTFSYIARFYNTDAQMVALSQLWTARAYAEMGWLYEAEQMMQNVKQKNLSNELSSVYAAFQADLLLKKKLYNEAIPFLELAVKSEKKKIQKQRFYYLLGQLYKKSGNSSAAMNAFSEVSKLNPSYEMDFNAQVNRAELNPDKEAVRKQLNKMIKNPNNKLFHDKLFYTLGNTYLHQGDSAKAIENFVIAADTSARDGYEKALILITLGDLYYDKKHYLEAQPRYSEAIKIITNSNDDFARVSRRAETLSELLVQHEILVLQDSLQKLATLPIQKRQEIVKNIIDKLIADEKAAEKTAELERRQNRLGSFEDNMDLPPLGLSPTSGEWYFYNPQLVKSGQNEFRKKWGNRKLEDNWRRKNKTAALFSEIPASIPATDSITDGDASKNEVNDFKNPEFYLKQIPTTDNQLRKSNEQIADALYQMAFIYKNKLEEQKLALETFEEFARRFPLDSRLEEVYYHASVLALKTHDASLSDKYKNKLIQRFPLSKYSSAISQPDYFENLAQQIREQDALYQATYEAYNNNAFDEVEKNTQYMLKEHPLSALMPKFLFLNALSKGKKGKRTEIENELSLLIEKYPNSKVISMAKDIQALLRQGNEAKAGTSHHSLLARRSNAVQTQVNESVGEINFSTEKNGSHRVIIVFPHNADKLNSLLFNIASYNFTRFMVKDFDLVHTKLDSIQTMLSVVGFESYDEGLWYQQAILEDAHLKKLLSTSEVYQYIISEQNYPIMFSRKGLKAYVDFLNTWETNTAQMRQSSGTTKNQIVKNMDLQSQATKPEIQQKNDQKQAPTPTPQNTNHLADKTTSEKSVTGVLPNQTAEQTKPASASRPTDVPLFKNLFSYQQNEPHFVAIVVLNGNFDYEKVKNAFDNFNSKYYSTIPIKITKEIANKQQILIIGPLPDAQAGKSYLFRIVREAALYEELKKTDYRNLIGSQHNLNVMLQNNAMNTYFEFMQEFYLK